MSETQTAGYQLTVVLQEEKCDKIVFCELEKKKKWFYKDVFLRKIILKCFSF